MQFTALASIVLAAAQVSLVSAATLEQRQILGSCSSTTLPLPLCGSIFGACSGSGCACTNVLESIPIVGGTLGSILGGLGGGLLSGLLPGLCTTGGSLPLGLTQCLELGCETDADCTCAGATCTPVQDAQNSTAISFCIPADFNNMAL
ncbi:hypothetical protein BD309DRAFT_969399 [Dichomitus squalens]|uniref:Hydrophobin n=1 Tax=Dichomitus squalens TaxID=114155 RepID=A0A4Q9NEQ8_9APHY|nr:uncharacterized protein DICSQDRAFT_124759 [Dichomitus squalens LYAD-421 SS1]EJF64514.1 hypothetical protein DICSQDRAFT_124759 [Dichomitus squalens LYAD-421 SS1]TBU32666.1 hypothetical protein BD311DRAFT_750472 [Dichomitus squalens]TBU39570.1 hypothetical protein BD309DRAFT_969399 [Dichomitus squalens]TBU55587.1 hypothetical protein BD310DRAFT_933418 [Dichomitus squalens]